VRYPDGQEHEQPEAAEAAPGKGQLVRLRIPHRIWTDDLPPAHDVAERSIERSAERTALGAE
jgi:hypothetical protein